MKARNEINNTLESDADNNSADLKISMSTLLDRQTARRLSGFDLEAQAISLNKEVLQNHDGRDLSLNEPQVSDIPYVDGRTDEHILDRIVKDHKLLLMKTLPAVDISFERTTIITQEGVFQLNQDVMKFKCLINAEAFAATLNELLFLLENANGVTEPQGVLAYNKLTLKQLNSLEASILTNQGHTIIGYLFSERNYIFMIDNMAKLLCRGLSQYPPLPDAYSRRFLRFINQPIMIDITSSLRVTAQTYILFSYFVSTYFQYDTNSHDDDYQFYVKNDKWLLLTLSGFIILNLVFLRSGFIDRTLILKELGRIRMIEQAIIGNASSLTNYGPLIASTSLIEDSFLPVLLLSLAIGYISHRSQRDVINIAYFTRSQFLLDSFRSSLEVGSFCAFGLYGPISDSLLMYANYTPSAQAAYFRDISIARYAAFTIMLFASLPRYPYASLRCQMHGLYISNLVRAISFALLDNYGLFIFIDDLYALGKINNPSEKNVVQAFFYGAQALAMLAVFLVSFPTTPDLVPYSIEANPINPTFLGKMHTFFHQMKSRCLQEKEGDRSQLQSSTSQDGLTLISSNYASFLRDKTSLSVLHLHPSNNVTQAEQNPMQEPVDEMAIRSQYG